MMMKNFDELSKPERKRATLHRDVQSICTETCHFLGLEITKPAMEMIAELVFRKLPIYGSDLEAFAKHAKRTTINSEDVKLLVRRNPTLKQHLNSTTPTPSSVTKEKRRKTVLPTAKDTPKPNDDVIPTKLNIDVTDRCHREPAQETIAKTTDNIKEPKSNVEELENMDIDNTIDLTID